MVELKPGAKFQSTVDTTQVIVIKGSGHVDLRCGGAPMASTSASQIDGTPAAPNSNGTLLGKRYSNEDASVEVLCTKAGEGPLSIADTPLEIAQTKALPASD